MTENRAYQKFVKRINDQNNKTILVNTIINYYSLTRDPLPENNMNELELPELKNICLTLCGEAINRDMIKYFTTGTRGTIGTELYRLLK